MSLFTDEELGIAPTHTLIGLTGFAQSGKDTVANILVSKYGYTRIAFADKIREFLYEVNPMVACSPTGYLKDLVNLVGWDAAKQEPQVRRLLQDLGVAARNIFGDGFWVWQAVKDLDSEKKYVITDVRFENELDFIRECKGQVWRVLRPGVSAVNSHVSESQIQDQQVDQVLVNSGTLEDLELLIKVRMQDALTR